MARKLSEAEKARFAAARDKHNAEMRHLVDLGMLCGMPGRLTPGETRISRAMAELDRMAAEDRVLSELQAAGDPEAMESASNAQRWNELHGHSLVFYREVLTTPIPIEEGNEKLLNIKLAAASKVITTSAKLAVERFRGQRVSAISRLLDRVKRLEGSEADSAPQTIGFED